MPRFIPLEKDIQKAILKIAKVTLGYKMDRRNTSAMSGEYKGKRRFVRNGQPGDSDLTGIVPSGPHHGKRIDVEIKRPGEKPTQDQLDRLQETIAAGGIGCWLDDPTEAYRVLVAIKEGWTVEIDSKGNQTLWRRPYELQ